MRIEISKWFNGADSPVFFMIDDLANTWVDVNHSGEVDWGEDWGYFKNADRSSFRFLNEKILKLFPEIKVTFFVPVGVRVGMSEQPVCRQISKPMNADEASKAFFKSIHNHPKFELAYHGTTHGAVGPNAKDFVQEWEMFRSVDEALERIDQGLAIFEDAVGMRPQGGKYCGYIGNEYSDESIDKAGFTWWCRYWNRGNAEEGTEGIGGSDTNPLTNYDVKRFGRTRVIDIPSTIDGGLLRGAEHTDLSVKGIAKRMLKNKYIKWKLREIDFLLEHRLVISIQEHMAPARDDGNRQNPNIFDDCNSLIGIFRYLQHKNVWYCTGTELANYVNLRDHVHIVPCGELAFALEHEAKYEHQIITLKFDEAQDLLIRLPDQTIAEVNHGVANVRVMKGEYSIIEGGD